MDLTEISTETLDLIKSTLTGAMNSSLGLFGVDLGDLVSLIPVDTPIRDMFPRETAGQGDEVARWRALLDVNNQQPSPFVGADNAGGLIKTKLQNCFAPYVPLAEGYSVTEDAVAFARGYADAKAVEIFNALNQWKIAEDKGLFGAQAFALPRPAAPTTTAATTGGSIAASTTVHIGVAARTGVGYFYCTGNSRGNTATQATAAGTATNTVSASVPAVRGAVAYDWFQSADGATWYYYTTTTVASVTMTSVIAANQAVPTTLPDLSSTVPTFNSATDNGSFDAAKQFNGIMASLSGDYGDSGLVTVGSGEDSGASFVDNAGGLLTVSGGGIAQFDSLNLAIYNKVHLSPTAYMMSAQDANAVSGIVLNNPGAVTYLTMNDATGRGEISAGGSVATYVNRSKPGAKIRLEVHPHVTPGTIVARCDQIPFPNANISQVWAVRCQRDVYDYIYGSDRASGGPRQDGEARSIETLICRAPVAQGVISNIGAAA